MSITTSDFLRHLHSLTARQALGSLSDKQLLERFGHERSQASFAVLVERHGPMVLNVCRRVLHHAQDAEDAFQATFLVLAKKAATLRQPPLLSAWLHGVAYRVSKQLQTKSQRRAVHERCIDPPPSGDVRDDITWRELRSVLDEELQKLPEKHRIPLVLCYLEAQTQEEAARRLGWSKSTFSRRLEQARQLLARRLTRRGLSLPAALTAPLLIDGAATAALPPLLAANTIRAGLAAAMGDTANGIVSAQVVALAENAVASLPIKKASIALVLLMSLTLGMGGLLAHRAVQNSNFAETPVPPPAQTSPQPARSASKEQTIEVTGRVLDPDGKPFAGAKVYISTYTHKDNSDPKVRSETDANGRFRFRANRIEVDEEEMLAAIAPGYGPDWVSLKEIDSGEELTLRLVEDDVPIKGRVLDLEGRPVTDAVIRLVRVQKMPDEDLALYLKELQTKAKDPIAVADVVYRYERNMPSVWGLMGSPKSVKTGANGRFELRGFGRDRVVHLRIEGPGIEYRNVSAMTRSLPVKVLPPDMHGSAFDHLAGPSKPIIGTVRDKGTGKPAAGVRVRSGEAETITGIDGRYKIPGVRKSDTYYVGVSGPPIIRYSKEVKDTPGLQPITVDFAVERGLVLQVRAREKGSGKPVRGLVLYALRSDNRALDRYTTFQRNLVSWDRNEKDGTYKQLVLPGPGYIAFRATNEQYVRMRQEKQKENTFLTGIVPGPQAREMFHAIVPIDPSAKEAQSLLCDILLERGRTVSGILVDPQARPLSGAMACGLQDVMTISPRDKSDLQLATANFTAAGLDPRYPRLLIFYHDEKKLAKAITLRGQEKGPLAVRMEPLGALTGRIVDADGKPKRGGIAELTFERRPETPLPQELFYSNHPLREALLVPRKITDKDGRFSVPRKNTDKDGRFRIEGLVAGMKYDLRIGGRVAKAVTGTSGVTDLGEIKVNAPSSKDGEKTSP